MRNTIGNMKIRKFRYWCRAASFVSGCHGQTIILGDDTRYWVVSMRDAAKLEKLGFELAV